MEPTTQTDRVSVFLVDRVRTGSDTRNHGETQDIRIHDGDREYITEVKEKLDDPESLAGQMSFYPEGDQSIGILASPLER